MLSRSAAPFRRVSAAVLVPTLLLELGRALWAASLSWQDAALHLVFVASVVLLGVGTHSKRRAQPGSSQPNLLVLLALIAAGAGLWLIAPTVNAGGWLLLIGCYGLLIGIDRILTHHVTWVRALALHVLVALAAGALPVALVQIESRFADEEFFAAIQVIILSCFWYVLRIASVRLAPHLRRSPAEIKSVHRGLVGVLFCLGGVWGTAYLVRAYQASFYTVDVPQYPGISIDAPFLCSTVTPPSLSVDGVEVFDKLMALVAENPKKGVPEYGMLALGTADAGWAQQFRLGLLDEAQQNRFAGPAGSVKYQQYLAAYRLYYYLRVDEAFPELFSPDERNLLRAWFAAINRRALTVEWVDWMYGLAFSAWPAGPYENQETGSALLSLMRLGDIGTPDLDGGNLAYLQGEARGWQWRFRNTDDAFAYQPEWITNAYFQSLATGTRHQSNLRKSFEWMALQLLPGGAPLSYNHPSVPHLGAVLYLGAELLDDPRFVWLADQYLDELAALGRYPYAQPGVEHALATDGTPPSQGSCLIYGDSGLPNQAGPLAPDKVVLRDGWAEDDTYLLLNLRFSGWHRYKATNAVSMLYWQGPLVVEVLDARRFDWLPEGRSLFRDKRIPRENLNGLLVERTGMSAVVQSLTGYGSLWAQDPPFYAEVVDFETSESVDRVETRLEDWRGWTHERSTFLFHGQGPIVVVDEAKGPAAKKAAVVWHLVGDDVEPAERFVLREGKAPVTVEMVNLDNLPHRFSAIALGDSQYQVIMQAEERIRLATVFLPGAWADADVSWDVLREVLTITSNTDSLEMDLSDRGLDDRP